MKNSAEGDAYFTAIDRAAAQWQPLIDALRAAGARDADMWQTGGMVMAIGWALPGHGESAHAMLTSDLGGLEHLRANEVSNSWMLGVYMGDADTGEASYFTIPGLPVDPSGDRLVGRLAVSIAAAAAGALAAEADV